MAKLAVLFFAALAFQAVLSAPTAQQQDQYIQHLVTKIQQLSTATVTGIENQKIATHVEKHSIQAEANELAHDLHYAVHDLQDVISNNNQHIQGENHQHLKEVVEHLSELVHSVQQSVNHEPAQLKNQLKTVVQNIVADFEKLAKVAKHTHGDKPGQHHVSVSHQLQNVLEDIVETIEILHIHLQVQHKTVQEINTHIETVVKKVSDVVEHITLSQEDVHEVVEVIQHLAEEISEIEHHLHHWVNNHETDVDHEIEEVAHHLGQIQLHLQQAANPQGDAVPQVAQLKVQVKVNLNEAAVQIKHLVQIVSTHQDVQEQHGGSVLLHTILADSLASVRSLHRELQSITGNIQDN